MASTTKNALTEEFREESITVRGTTYTFREASAEEYDEIIKIASGEDDNAELAVVLKLLAAKCLLEPKLSSEQLYKKPYPVVQALLRKINTMHFSPEESEAEKAPNS